MPYILTSKNEPAPDGYGVADLRKTVPGADWYIDGRRYHETGREPTETGFTITLERADIDAGHMAGALPSTQRPAIEHIDPQALRVTAATLRSLGIEES